MDTGRPPDIRDARPVDSGVEPSVLLADPPPKFSSGGTLAITPSGVAVAADTDRDALFFVDIGEDAGDVFLGELPFTAGDAPERIALSVVDGRDVAFVVLRAVSEVAFVDVAERTLLGRHPVCAAPRGITATEAFVYVACGGGELLTLSAATGEQLRSLSLAPDLRDVVIVRDDLYVSRMRAAEVLVVGLDGAIRATLTPPAYALFEGRGVEVAPGVPNSMVRIVAHRDGVIALSQLSRADEVIVDREGYQQVLAPQVSYLSMTPSLAAPLGGVVFGGVVGVPMDIVSSGPEDFALVTTVGLFGGSLRGDSISENFRLLVPLSFDLSDNMPTAVAVRGNVVATLESQLPGVRVHREGISDVSFEGAAPRRDTGLELFYATPSGNTACASCHPFAGDDGHTWVFNGVGARRTQPLTGGLLDTAPFHWAGDQPDLGTIMAAAFTERLMGGPLSTEQVEAIGRFLDAQPAPRGSISDTDAVARGRVHFEETGCASCHSGPKFTDNSTVDVGTGGEFQVPPLLGLAERGPYLHHGCAPTLEELFECGIEGQHADIRGLDDPGFGDLNTYLRSL